MKRFFALSLLIVAVGCGASTTSQTGNPPPPGGTPTPSPTGGSGGNTSGPAVTVSADHTAGVAPLPVAFTANVTGGSGSTTLQWSFGDGTNGSGTNAAHTYANPGSFSATVTATDSAGHSGHATLVIAVGSAQHPVVAAGATPASGAAPLNVTFQASAAGGSGTLTYAWNFGDTTSATNSDTTQNPSHTFNTKGSFTAKVTVTDASGNASTASVTVVVNDPPTGGGGGGGGTPTPTPLPDLQVTNFTATESGLSDPYEPNDTSAYYLGDYGSGNAVYTVSDAYIDEKDTTYSATIVNFGPAISTPFDVDFYYNASSQPADGDFGTDYQTIASMDANSTQDVSFTVNGPTAGTATTSWVRADSGSAIDEADETNNDSSADFTPTGDSDWYAVAEDGGFTLQISLTNLPADYDLYLLDANGTQVASSENSGTTAESISYLTPGSSSGSPSLYFIGVVPYQGAYDSANPYTLTVTVP